MKSKALTYRDVIHGKNIHGVKLHGLKYMD